MAEMFTVSGGSFHTDIFPMQCNVSIQNGIIVTANNVLCKYFCDVITAVVVILVKCQVGITPCLQI